MTPTTLAILPIKRFEHAKQRLGDQLDGTPRRALVQAMFSDALIALNRAARVDSILVALLSRQISIASRHGRRVFWSARSPTSITCSLTSARRSRRIAAPFWTR